MNILTPIAATCLTCRWFVQEGSTDETDEDALLTGTCHRHCPPWFDVVDTDFCGDWTSDYSPVPRRHDD